MKQKKLLKRLRINRSTVANLNLQNARGGVEWTKPVELCNTKRPVLCGMPTRAIDCADSLDVVNCETRTDTGGTQCNTECMTDCATCYTC